VKSSVLVGTSVKLPGKYQAERSEASREAKSEANASARSDTGINTTCTSAARAETAPPARPTIPSPAVRSVAGHSTEMHPDTTATAFAHPV